MATTNRMLRILALFDIRRPVITLEFLISELAVSRASVYRDLSQLASAGLIERVADRGYVLGPKVVELDRQIRLGDPLLQAAETPMQTLADDTGGAVLLCRLHANSVTCIAQVNGNNPALSVSYERGRPMPLYKGATSKIILAHLAPMQIKQLWVTERGALIDAGLPADFAQLDKALCAIRNVGYHVTEGEVDPNATGFAAPIREGEHLLGSLSVVMPATALTAVSRKSTLARLQSTAGRIEGRLQDQRESERMKKQHNGL